MSLSSDPPCMRCVLAAQLFCWRLLHIILECSSGKMVISEAESE